MTFVLKEINLSYFSVDKYISYSQII